jgi:predicted alpha/beta superfamily hydrolase
MKLLVLLFLVLIVSCSNPTQPESLETSKQIIYSKNVKDSFELYITQPQNYSVDSVYPVVYYLDANLKSGKVLRRVINEMDLNGKSLQAIFVGVGHIGNYRVLRRRDFVTPYLKAGDSLYSNEADYGRAASFYSFLQEELIPYIETSRKTSNKRTLVGHSFGGLFAFYCLFQKQSLFQNYVALSPSLWVNYGNIYEFEDLYRKNSTALDATVYLRAGSNETINKVLPACEKMNAFLKIQAYSGLKVNYKVIDGESHNSHVEESLKEILAEL